MNTKRILIIATALLMASQAYALTAAEKNIGCNNDVGGCPSGSTGSGGGAGGAEYVGAYNYGGALWEDFFDQKNGNFSIETTLSGPNKGDKKVHFQGKSSPLIKPPPQKEKMKFSDLAYGAMTPAQVTPAIAKQKADEAKAKAEADKKAAEAKAKAEADKKAAEAKAFQDKQAAQDAADNKAAADKAKAEAAVRSNKAGAGQALTKAPQPPVSAAVPQKKP